MDRLLHFNIDPIVIKNEFMKEFGHLKGASFNPAFSGTKSFFEYLIKNKIYLDTNPMELLKRKKEAKKIPNPFKDSEVEQILNRCRPDHKFMYEIFLNTGVRLDELLHLKFKDFDSERKFLHVHDRSSGGGGKGDKGRKIPIPDLLLKKYENYLADYRLKKPSHSDYIFVNYKGFQLSRAAVSSRMRTLRNKLRFRIHPHRFRATYATHLHRAGHDIYVISLLMGHEDIDTTKGYIYVSEERLRTATSSTWLGKKSEELKRIETLDREKQDLLALVNDLIKQNQTLLERIRSFSP